MSNEKAENSSPQHGPEKIRVYAVRWVILGIFVAYSAVNAMQWIQFSIIADVVTKYYDVDLQLVNWTSMSYMVLFIVFVFPASYIMEYWGLRKTVLLGIFLTCVGAWIKLLAVKNAFWVALVGQFVVASANGFVLSVPSRLAAVWFGRTEVALACSIGVFGNQLGIALGFLIPPMIVSNQSTREEQEQQFYILFGGIAAFATATMILIIIFFKDAPPNPPSVAALQQIMEEYPSSFWQSLKKIIANKSFVLLWVAYGIDVGVFYAISTLLNQIVIHHYGDGAATDAGRIGLVIAVVGTLGSLTSGFFLDKWHRYKLTTLAVYALSLIFMVTYTFTISRGIYVVYIVSALLGFFMAGLLPVGFEFGVELTYPEPEGTSTGLLNLSCQISGIFFTMAYTYLLTNFNDTWANLAMSIMLVFGTVLLAFTSSQRKRHDAQL